MLHKHLAGHRSHIRSILSIMLCLALVCGTVASMSVFAAEPQTETELATETAMEASETSEENTEKETEAQTVDLTEAETAAESETVAESLTESTEARTAEVETKEAAAGSTSPAVELTGSVDGVSVSVNAPEGAFASGVSMVVSAVDVDAFAEAVVADCVASDGGTYTVYDAAAVEISFYDVNGAEVQPTTEVEVTLGNLDLNTGDDDLTKYAIIYHMNDDGTMEYIADGNPGESSYTFSASSFSTYGLIIASVEYDAEAVPGPNPGQGGNNGPSTISVFWDTVTVGSNGTTLTANNSTTGVQSVTMDGSTVPHGNGGSSNNSGGLSYTMTYGGDDTATIVITPSTGYYVTFVSVNCCGSGAATSCQTYGEGNAFTANFTIDSSGTITINVPLDDETGFHHDSNSSTYFILIHVSPVPSPLYVQYEYGNVTDFLSDVAGTVFADTDAWTDTDSNNNMVNSSTTGGGVVTDDTQYKYTYATGNESDASSWTHYANSITSDAKALAASYGYYFAGWEVTYYTDCTDFSFSGVYGSGSSYYQEGANVPLITHVKLVAVWVPAEVTPGTLTISKSISGIDTALVSSITFTVTDVNGESVGTVTLSETNGWTGSISNITPGNYTVTESGYEVSNYNCIASVDDTDLNGYSATVTVTSGDVQTTLGSDGLYSYSVETNNASVAFTNTYTPSTMSVTVVKKVDGNMGDKTKKFSFTVTNGSETVASFDLSDGGSKTINDLAIGSDITVSESGNTGYNSITIQYGSYNTDGDFVEYKSYETTVSSSTATITLESGYDVVLVTNYKNATPDTGINLDSAPYIAILLGVVLFGSAFLIHKRRRLL